MSGKFELKRSPNGEFHFHLLADSGHIILSSETYKARASAQNGIESVRKNSAEDHRFERKTSTSGRPYFVLKARNGEIIGQSQMFSNAEQMEDGIQQVKRDAPAASVSDLSH